MRQTGLVKVCPRCGATGRVLLDQDGLGFVILWTDGLRAWRDTGVSAAALVDPDSGCGYDGERVADSEQHRRSHCVGLELA